ncbi:LAMI_0H09472g1_1 [Lachancea mirantina]|uniref:Non-structural maintenance of chromosomes element 1 homolog n=1 Tax=Lachancea mirantina TaxID=1230905 RepID=A0A1G4KGF7_9SACH|nr:LAMI_0H09472g1_1 [Lachancea mirantina]
MVEETRSFDQQTLTGGFNDTKKRLLRYILLHRGVCSHSSLLNALRALEQDEVADEVGGEVNERLDLILKDINVNLSKVGYSVLRCYDRYGDRCYAYIDVGQTAETKLATTFNADELEYVKWCIASFMKSGGIVHDVDDHGSRVRDAVDDILERASSSSQRRLDKVVSYTEGSLHLCDYVALGASRAEELLVKLCKLKWFYRTAGGRVGLDTRGVLELNEYLSREFETPQCCACVSTTLSGVICSCRRSAWHVACFQHTVVHLTQECAECGQSLLNAFYLD